jgi:hypothetical protein
MSWNKSCISCFSAQSIPQLKAIGLAGEIQLLESRAVCWVARDTLRELRSEKVQ